MSKFRTTQGSDWVVRLRGSLALCAASADHFQLWQVQREPQQRQGRQRTQVHRRLPLRLGVERSGRNGQNDQVCCCTVRTTYIVRVLVHALCATTIITSIMYLAFIRSLSKQLTKAKTDLAPHNLVEVRAGKSWNKAGSLFRPLMRVDDKWWNVVHCVLGSYVLSPESALSRRGLGSLEFALLGLACAVFFGAFIAVITVVSLRYRRYSKKY